MPPQLATIAAGILISKRLLNALGAEPVVLCNAVINVASRELTGELHVRPSDHASVLAAVQRMQLSLVQVVSSVRQDSELVSSAAAEISTGNNDLSSKTEHQARALEETALSMKELTSTVRQNAEPDHRFGHAGNSGTKHQSPHAHPWAMLCCQVAMLLFFGQYAGNRGNGNGIGIGIGIGIVRQQASCGAQGIASRSAQPVALATLQATPLEFQVNAPSQVSGMYRLASSLLRH